MDNTKSNIPYSIYILNVAQLPDIACEQLYAVLPSARRQRADSIRHPAARALSIGAAALLYAVLDQPHTAALTLLQANDVSADHIRQAVEKRALDWTPDDHGRPFPGGIPTESGRLYASLSHSGEWAAAAISFQPLGMDIQGDNSMSETSQRAILRKFHPREKDVLDRLEGTAFHDAFFRWWTMKESVMKLTGKGFRLPLNGFQVAADGAGLYNTDWCGRHIQINSCSYSGIWIACAQWDDPGG